MMKCPLLLMAGIAHEGEPRCPTQECLQENCAWWDLELGQCSMVTLARQAHNIYSILDLIADKMPFAGQFTK